MSMLDVRVYITWTIHVQVVYLTEVFLHINQQVLHEGTSYVGMSQVQNDILQSMGRFDHTYC